MYGGGYSVVQRIHEDQDALTLPEYEVFFFFFIFLATRGAVLPHGLPSTDEGQKPFRSRRTITETAPSPPSSLPRRY